MDHTGRRGPAGQAVDKCLIYKLLGNRAYLGELRHKMQWYLGEHEPIVDRKLWDDVQVILATNGRRRSKAARATVPFLLRGLCSGRTDGHSRPGHAQEERAALPVLPADPRQQGACGGPPACAAPAAGRVEAALLEQLRGLLRAPGMVADVVGRATGLDPTLDEAQVTVAMIQLDQIWDQLFPAEQSRIVRLLVERVIVSPNNIEVRLRANGIEELALELRQAVPEKAVA